MVRNKQVRNEQIRKIAAPESKFLARPSADSRLLLARGVETTLCVGRKGNGARETALSQLSAVALGLLSTTRVCVVLHGMYSSTVEGTCRLPLDLPLL